MNKLKGVISEIDTADQLSLVSVEVEGLLFSSVVISSSETAGYLQVGKEVYLVFKETEVSIGKELSGGLSIRNRFPVHISEIKEGKILTQLTLDFHGHLLQSIITTRSARTLALHEGDRVEGLVKTNEITLMQP
ncbi:MAG: TOBE domain-containing protein [Bacteroidota bacterium]